MTKMIKLSLVAALAVAGLSTTAAADAVKYSGNVSYTMEDLSGDATKAPGTTSDEAAYDIDIRLNIAATVNDNVTANVRLDENGDNDSGNSASKAMVVDRTYFTYKNNATTVNFGLLGTPLSYGGQGDGVTVSQKVGSVSLTGGYYYSTSSTNDDELAFVNATGTAGPVGYYGTYAIVKDSDDTQGANTRDANILLLEVNGKFGPVTAALAYGQRSLDDAADTKYKQTKLTLGANLGMVALKAAYAKNGEDGGDVTLANGWTHKSNIFLGATDLGDAAKATDADAIYVEAKFNATAKDSIKLAYAAVNDKVTGSTAADRDTMLVNYTHKMSSNFALSANYEMNDLDAANADFNELTLGANYTF